MRDFSFDSDQAVTPDGIEFDPFEMDWPWPGMAKPAADPDSPMTTTPHDPSAPPLS